MKPSRIAALAPLSLWLAGCNRNPNIEIVGSYFPGWMICLTLGVILTGIAHALFRRAGLLLKLGPPVILYPSLLTLFTCLLWLCFFA